MRERTFAVHEQLYDASSFNIYTERELVAWLEQHPALRVEELDIVECIGDMLTADDLTELMAKQGKEESHG